MPTSATIVAPASAPGRAAVAIVRLSGPRALAIANGVFTPRRGAGLDARRSHTMVHGTVKDQGMVVDDILAVAMRAPRSYTGEDVVEFQCHGGPMIVQRMLDLLARAGARPAQPGEFTRRAVLNGMLTLTQAEAVADAIGATTERARRAAVANLGGALARAIDDARAPLISLLAEIEASIEFPDDVDGIGLSGAWPHAIDDAQTIVTRLLATADAGRVLHDGYRVAIAGRPNAGKSSLLNRLAREERALVTDIPGTTRDAIEADVDIAGYPVRLFDTAGIRTARGAVEQLGVERARTVIASCDLILWLANASAKPRKTEADEVAALAGTTDVIWLWSKSDLGARWPDASRAAIAERWPTLDISATTGDGIHDLERMLATRLDAQMPSDTDQAIVLRARHKEALEHAATALDRAREGLEAGPSELVAEDLREALEAFAELNGSKVAEDVLDRIFSEFCIGK